MLVLKNHTEISAAHYLDLAVGHQDVGGSPANLRQAFLDKGFEAIATLEAQNLFLKA